MARIRSIKPGFFKNEHIADLPMQVRLLFIGLWTLADKEGKLEDRPKRIKAELFPYDTLDVDSLLSKLQSAGLIIRYEVGDLKLVKVINFSKHQRITGNESLYESEFPDPSNENILETLGNNVETTMKQLGSQEGKGIGKEEGKGEEEAAPRPSYKKFSEKDFYDEVAKFKDCYSKELLREFYNYWREKSATGKLMRFQKQGTWDTNLRLQRWKNKQKDFMRVEERFIPSASDIPGNLKRIGA